MKNLPKILLISGPTAVGKSAIALEIARQFNAEIINGDSLQIYRHLDIGTAKPALSERQKLPHHLFDILNPDQPFNAIDFQAQADAVIADIHSRDALPLVVGGTGLYLKALLFGLCQMPEIKPEIRAELERRLEKEGSKSLHSDLSRLDSVMAARLAPRDKTRILRALETVLATGKSITYFQEQHKFSAPRYNFSHIFLDLEREQLYQRINRRVEIMIEMGLISEAQGLLDRGYTPELKPLQSIGYRQVFAHLDGKISLDQAVADTQQATRHYAKRQLTWFRKDKHALKVEVSNQQKIVKIINSFLNQGV